MRMTGRERREQILGIAEEEFATAGLYGASTETIARRAGITQAYVFRLFGTKKQLFLACVDAAFGRMTLAMLAAAGGSSGIEALTAMGQEYNEMLADRTTLLLQLQGTAAPRPATARSATPSVPASPGSGRPLPTRLSWIRSRSSRSLPSACFSTPTRPSICHRSTNRGPTRPEPE